MPHRQIFEVVVLRAIGQVAPQPPYTRSMGESVPHRPSIFLSASLCV